MSFQDLKYCAKQTASSSDVAAAISEINTSVAAFRRLVDALGTSKDTPNHRLNLQNTTQRILQLLKTTSANLKSHRHSSVTASKKIEDAKLARDFQIALQEFQTLLHLASHQYSTHFPSSAFPSSSSSSASIEAVEYPADHSHQPLLMEVDHSRQQVIMVGNEIAFNEAIIEEREEGIIDIQVQIDKANQILKDLAVLVHQQGVVVDDIHSNIDDSSAATTESRVQLAKASKSVKSTCSWCWWVVLVMFVVALFIFLVFLFL